MNSADLVVRLRFQGRYASETQQECTERKNNERIEAAGRIEALEVRLAEAMEVLRPFVKMTAGEPDTLLVSTRNPIFRRVRRLVEKEDGR